MGTDAVDSPHGADLHAPTEMPDQSHPGEDGTPFIERFPSVLAGAPISNAEQSMPGFPQNGLGTDSDLKSGPVRFFCLIWMQPGLQPVHNSQKTERLDRTKKRPVETGCNW